MVAVLHEWGCFLVCVYVKRYICVEYVYVHMYICIYIAKS